MNPSPDVATIVLNVSTPRSGQQAALLTPILDERGLRDTAWSGLPRRRSRSAGSAATWQYWPGFARRDASCPATRATAARSQPAKPRRQDGAVRPAGFGQRTPGV